MLHVENLYFTIAYLQLHLFSGQTTGTGIKLDGVFPDFEASTTSGKIRFYKWLDESWGILFANPTDYRAVSTTELGRICQLEQEFKKRDVKLIALSLDSLENHKGWIEDIKHVADIRGKFPYPIIADEKRELAVKLGIIDPDEKDSNGMHPTARAVFVIGPDRKMKLSSFYPATTGISFSEVLRVIDSLQLTMNKKVATPADWKFGGDCLLLPTVSGNDAMKIFPEGVRVREVPSGKTYLRFTPQPE